MSHLMSLSGVKRTWPIAVHMSAVDPKRTLGALSYDRSEPLRCLSCGLGGNMKRREFVALIGCVVGYVAASGACAADRKDSSRRLFLSGTEGGRSNSYHGVFGWSPLRWL